MKRVYFIKYLLTYLLTLLSDQFIKGRCVPCCPPCRKSPRIDPFGMAMSRILLCSVACASALTMTPQLSASAASARMRAAALRMDDIPMTKDSRGVEPKKRDAFTCSFEIPAKGIAEYGTVNMKFRPVLTDSELVYVTYKLPFGLSAEPRGRVVSVTKDGEGGEKVGDILRFTLEWQGGQASPAMFDVCSCMERRLETSFDRVVQALTSNDGTCALAPLPEPTAACPLPNTHRLATAG